MLNRSYRGDIVRNLIVVYRPNGQELERGIKQWNFKLRNISIKKQDATDGRYILKPLARSILRRVMARKRRNNMQRALTERQSNTPSHTATIEPPGAGLAVFAFDILARQA